MTSVKIVNTQINKFRTKRMWTYPMKQRHS